MVGPEEIGHAARYREAYRSGVESVLAARRAEADRIRARYISPARMAANGEHCRRGLAALLGWPLAGMNVRRDAPEAHVCEEKPYTPGVTMKRLQIETLPGLPFYGILFLPEDGGKHPLVIAQHGGGGTPELAADLYGPNNYRHMIARLTEAGCAVFAPQLLLWQEESSAGIPGCGSKTNRGALEDGLRQSGGSIAALEVYCIMRSLDRLLTLPQVDADRVGMIGLSYGGMYTQLTAALDTRIRAAVSNAFFNDRYAYCWHDFSWRDSAMRFRDAEICGLIAPRALCVHVGRKDAVFSVDTALPETEKLRLYYEAQGASGQLAVIISDVNHTLTDHGEEMDFLLRHLRKGEKE